MCLWNIVHNVPFWAILTHIFDLGGWPWPFTTQTVQLHKIHMHAKYQVAIFNIAKVMILTHIFDLEGWPWPFTTQNVQLHEIHMHAKYQVAIFNIAKVMANVKVCANKQTNQPTDRANTNLNASDSGLHHTVSLMYVGGRHIGTTFENKMAVHASPIAVMAALSEGSDWAKTIWSPEGL